VGGFSLYSIWFIKKGRVAPGVYEVNESAALFFKKMDLAPKVEILIVLRF
jgi:hypothetical protein